MSNYDSERLVAFYNPYCSNPERALGLIERLRGTYDVHGMHVDVYKTEPDHAGMTKG